MLTPNLLKQIRMVATEHPVIVATIIKSLEQLNTSGYDEAIKVRLLGQLSNRNASLFVSELLKVWQLEVPQISSREIATALSASEYCYRVSEEDLKLELTWTGPQNLDVPMRRTDQALLELINNAQKQLTIVSFAVYKIPEIVLALKRALDRGVEVKLILETAESSNGKVTGDLVLAFGNQILKNCTIYIWPLDKRVRDENDHYGTLHAKCAVADGKWICLSSANFTDFAMKLNMEMGMLITNEILGQKIEMHFNRLISSKVLVIKRN